MNTLESGYKEESTWLAGAEVTIATYRVVDQFVCVISNRQPGAVIARAVGDTKTAALELGKRLAEERIAGTESTLPISSTPKVQPEIQTELLGIDRVEMDPVVSVKVRYTLDEFLALPTMDRIQMILSGKLQFFGLDGKLIPPGTAIEYMHKYAAKASVV